MPEIKVTFGALAAAQGDVSSSAGRLMGQLGDLKGFLAPMVATWEGRAAQDYQFQQTKWDQAAADLHQVLSSIGIALGAAHDGYSQAEATNTSRWQV